MAVFPVDRHLKLLSSISIPGINSLSPEGSYKDLKGNFVTARQITRGFFLLHPRVGLPFINVSVD